MCSIQGPSIVGWLPYFVSVSSRCLSVVAVTFKSYHSTCFFKYVIIHLGWTFRQRFNLYLLNSACLWSCKWFVWFCVTVRYITVDWVLLSFELMLHYYVPPLFTLSTPQLEASTLKITMDAMGPVVLLELNCGRNTSGWGRLWKKAHFIRYIKESIADTSNITESSDYQSFGCFKDLVSLVMRRFADTLVALFYTLSHGWDSIESTLFPHHPRIILSHLTARRLHATIVEASRETHGSTPFDRHLINIVLM